MPFLRRRGNVASETNMRQHANEHSADVPPVSRLSTASSADEEAIPHSQPNLLAIAEGTGSVIEQDSSRPSTPVQEQSQKHRRFSMLRFRNASDSQLSLRAKQHAEVPPPIPQPPHIITTVPTGDLPVPQKKVSRRGLAVKLRFSAENSRDEVRRSPSKKSTKSFSEETSRTSLAALEEPAVLPSLQYFEPPLPIQMSSQRASESSRSDVGSAEHTSQGSPLSTPRKNPKSSPFFKLRRTKKHPAPLFDLSHLPRKDDPNPAATSTHSLSANGKEKATDGAQRTTPAVVLLTAAGRSGQSSPTRATTLLRGRSSTMSSTGRDSTDDHLMPPTARTSSSTGRKSFSDLLGLSRLRHNSDLSRQGSFSPATPGSITSKNNSLQLTREAFSLPERRDDESPAKYLARVEEVMNRGLIGAALSKGADAFSTTVLRSFMRSFSFFGDPMDMSIRKLLMEAELPKETQHIDRFLQAFANRYHECNPGIFASTDQAYFIAFSLLILHTDVFNKNNKHKMQKPDYLKNTRDEGVCEEVLECFYDNISYTPFIHVEDDTELSGERPRTDKQKKTPLHDPAKLASKEPIDPYTLILDGNLDSLRPNLKDSMFLEEHYNYLGTASGFNLTDLQKTFFRTGVLQIVSARSRPDAFMSDKMSINPAEALPGIVDIKVTKVGLLWRKDPRKRKTRSPWQEWGAILTGAQLYFFRNVSWAKNLIHQYEHHIKQGNDGIPIIFKPPLDEFKPDALISTNGAVALQDTKYKRHKNAFLYVREGRTDEVLLADNEEEMNDWLAKLNYAAAFRTSGVRIPGIGGGYEGHGKRSIRRMESSEPTQTVDTPTGPVSIVRGQIDKQMVEDIQTARRDVTRRKIDEANDKLAELEKLLDEQLRNARHLQILAPIQLKSREQLLLSADKMEYELKWIRMEMWKEKCHRDILAQDLEEDDKFTANYNSAPTQLKPARPERSGSPIRKSSELRATSLTEKPLVISKDNYSLGEVPSASDIVRDVESSLDKVFHTPPAKITTQSQERGDFQTSRPDNNWASRNAGSSLTSPEALALSVSKQAESQLSRSHSSSGRPNGEHDDIDADERHFLKQAGLLGSERTKDVAAAEKMTSTLSTDSGDHGPSSEKEKAEVAKIRRSLHRTLRDGAGHLSHHRSKKGKDQSANTGTEEASEAQLSRGTGSFMVHGKKASVIRLATELQNMSQDEKIPRKHIYDVVPTFPSSLEDDDDDDFVSAVGVPLTASDNGDRRESEASASTATARSFRELHRKYSTAQAARNSSGAMRLNIPSDGDSEAAVSFSDGPRSPLPMIETESEDESDGEQLRASDNPGEKSHPKPSSNGKVEGQLESSFKDEDDASA